MNKILKFLNQTEGLIMVVTISVMTLAAFAQVVNRNLIGASISWFDELARYCMVYMTLFAAEAGLRNGTQIAVTAFSEKCSTRIQKLLKIIVELIVIAFAVIVLYYSKVMIGTALRSGQISPGLRIPMVIPYAVIPVSFAAISIVHIFILYKIIKTDSSTLSKKEA